MRSVVLGVIVALTGFAASGLSQTVDTIEKSLSVSGVPDVTIVNEDGRTKVTSHDGNTVEVRATKEVRRASDAAEAERLAAAVEVRIEQEGDRVSVRTIYPKVDWTFWQNADVVVHLDVRTPRRSALNLESEDGDVEISGLEGDLKLTVEDGDLQVSDCSGSMDIVTEDGDVDMNGVRGRLSARLDDGDLDVRGVLSELQAETEDGELDIRLLPESAMNADWSVQTDDGSVRLELPTGFAADLSVSVDDGSIEIDHPVTLQGKISDEELSTKLNGGGHRLKIRTSDGSVRILQP